MELARGLRDVLPEHSLLVGWLYRSVKRRGQLIILVMLLETGKSSLLTALLTHCKL